MSIHQADWQRQDQPILSTMTTKQDWCRVVLYNPTVIRVEDRFMMWYLGNSTATRTNDVDLGFAESTDGIQWTEHPDNPILTRADLPACDAWQTPHVMFDADEGMFRMWFVMSTYNRDGQGGLLSFSQQLGYAAVERFQCRPRPCCR